MVGTIDVAATSRYTASRQDPSRRGCRGRVDGRFWNAVDKVSSFLGHERFQKAKPWSEVDRRSVANSEDVDSMFVEDSFKLGEEIGGRRRWDRAEVVDVSVFSSFSGVQPAFGNNTGRSITRGRGAIAVRDHTLTLFEEKVMMDKAGGVKN